MDIENLIHEAFQCFNRDENENALRLYQEVLLIDPQCSKALLGCGVVLAEIENFQAAIEYFSQAIQFDPNDAGAFAFRSFAYVRLGNLEDALNDSNRAVNLEPNIRGYYRAKAEILVNLKRYKESLQCFKQVLQLEPEDSEALRAIEILSDTLLIEQFLPPLEELADKLDCAFTIFDEEHRGIFDEDRKNVLRTRIVPISDESSKLMEEIDRPLENKPLEILLIYSYIQAVARGCGAIRVYGVDAGKERLDESRKYFSQAEKIAESSEDLIMLKRLNLKRGAIIFSLYKTWGTEIFALQNLSIALESYSWLSSHSELLNSEQEQLVCRRLIEVNTAITARGNSSTDDINRKIGDLARGALAFNLFESFGGLERLNAAFEYYSWLNSHSELLNPEEKELVRQRFTEINATLKQIRDYTDDTDIDLDTHTSYGYLNLSTNKQIALGVGALGVVLLIGGQWFIGLICIGFVWYFWQNY